MKYLSPSFDTQRYCNAAPGAISNHTITLTDDGRSIYLWSDEDPENTRQIVISFALFNRLTKQDGPERHRVSLLELDEDLSITPY